jgi:hypothetical protein
VNWTMFEGNEHVELVTGRLHVYRSEMNLEGRDAVCGPDRRPDLCRIIRERGQVTAGECVFHGELRAGQLHAVAGITRKAHDY